MLQGELLKLESPLGILLSTLFHMGEGARDAYSCEVELFERGIFTNLKNLTHVPCRELLHLAHDDDSGLVEHEGPWLLS